MLTLIDGDTKIPDIGFHVKNGADSCEEDFVPETMMALKPIYITPMPSLDFSVDIGEYRWISLSLNWESFEKYTLETNSSKLMPGLGRSGLDQRIRFKSGTQISFLHHSPALHPLSPTWGVFSAAESPLDHSSKSISRVSTVSPMLFHSWGHWPSHPMSLKLVS